MPRGVYRRPWQPEPPEPKRLTGNPAKAAVIRLPSGKAMQANAKAAVAWLNQTKS